MCKEFVLKTICNDFLKLNYDIVVITGNIFFFRYETPDVSERAVPTYNYDTYLPYDQVST